MRIGSRSLATLLAVLVLASCASDDIPVSVVFDPLARFPAQANYAWDEEAIRMPTDPLIVEMGLGPLIRQVAEQAFAARGYTRVNDASGADYLLSYQWQVTTFIAADASNSVGAISFLLVDPATERRLWKGWGRDDFFAGATPEHRRARLADAMTRMLEKFPPDRSGPE